MKKFILIFIFTLLLIPSLSLANPTDPPQSSPPQSNSGAVQLENPLGKDMTDPADLVNKIVQGVLGITGVIALVAFVAGGLAWMTSGGNAEKVKKGKDIMVWAVLGLFIIFSSYSILKYVFDVIG